ncbi:unnamed protein product, partial [Pylaiella littoralis]
PISHAASTAEGVAKMWETLQSLDYKAPAKKWKEEWEFKDGDKKGQVDKGKAREKILGWWKDMRSEYRVAVKNVGKSGEHAEHKWSFCGNKFYVMLMIDWYQVRGGHKANDHCQQYFKVKLDEDTGSAFSSLSTEFEQASSDSDDDTMSCGKRKLRARGGGKANSKAEEALNGLVEALKSSGAEVAAAIAKLADNDKLAPAKEMVSASNLVDDLEDALDEEMEGKNRPRKIARIRANLE